MNTPKGYRKLRVGETIRSGDKVLVLDGWIFTARAGEKVLSPQLHYIRIKNT